ncbi:phage protein Gp27 family protein [Ruegeria sp.]|uniref:phage protein Gp27 family protein n=1 Tax=Ruegeria sp. TaxID=1879320 RepID=UPI003B5A0961
MRLPKEVRAQLDTLLIEKGFSDYKGLADWLAGLGHDVSAMSVHRHGAKLERAIRRTQVATEQARALVAASPDDEGVVAEAMLRMAQERLHTFMMALEEGSPKEIAPAARAMAHLVRASTALRAERRRALLAAGTRVEQAAIKAGISPETSARLRAEVEGTTGAEYPTGGAS